MNIKVTVTNAEGIKQTMELNNAPQGTELVVLEQFFAGPTDTTRMILETSSEAAGANTTVYRQPPAPTADFDEQKAWYESIVEAEKMQTHQDIKNLILASQKPAPVGMVALPAQKGLGTRKAQQQAADRIQATKDMRKVNALYQAAEDCLALLYENRKLKQRKTGTR